MYENRVAEEWRYWSELNWNADVIVCSSCKNEDTQDASMAGKFEFVVDGTLLWRPYSW